MGVALREAASFSGRLAVGFGHLTERTEDKGRGTGFVGFSPAPNSSSRCRVGGRKETAGPGKVGPAVPSPPPSRGSGLLSRRRQGDCIFKSEPPAPSAAEAPALAGPAVAAAVIGGPAGPAPRRLGARDVGTRSASWIGARGSHRWLPWAPALVASIRRTRPDRLRSPFCPRMGWGSGEERAAARARRALPLPDSAPAVWAQRAGRGSADAPWSRGLAGTCASGSGAGEGRADLGVLCSSSPARAAQTTQSPSPETTPSPSSGAHAFLGSSRGEVLGLHPDPRGVRAWERSGTSRTNQ